MQASARLGVFKGEHLAQVVELVPQRGVLLGVGVPEEQNMKKARGVLERRKRRRRRRKGGGGRRRRRRRRRRKKKTGNTQLAERVGSDASEQLQKSRIVQLVLAHIVLVGGHCRAGTHWEEVRSQKKKKAQSKNACTRAQEKREKGGALSIFPANMCLGISRGTTAKFSTNCSPSCSDSVALLAMTSSQVGSKTASTDRVA